MFQKGPLFFHHWVTSPWLWTTQHNKFFRLKFHPFLTLDANADEVQQCGRSYCRVFTLNNLMRDRVPSLLWLWSDTTWLCVAPVSVSEKVSSGRDTIGITNSFIATIFFRSCLRHLIRYVNQLSERLFIAKKQQIYPELPLNVWPPHPCPLGPCPFSHNPELVRLECIRTSK